MTRPSRPCRQFRPAEIVFGALESRALLTTLTAVSPQDVGSQTAPGSLSDQDQALLASIEQEPSNYANPGPDSSASLAPAPSDLPTVLPPGVISHLEDFIGTQRAVTLGKAQATSEALGSATNAFANQTAPAAKAA